MPTAPVDRPVVGSCPSYDGTQRAVGFLSGNRFPVKRAALIGARYDVVAGPDVAEDTENRPTELGRHEG